MADTFLSRLGPFAMFPSFCSWACLFLWICGVSSSPLIPRTDSTVALADDVNVLMYGVLQFSESLHHVYQNTEAKLERITRAITNTERLVRNLDQETEQTILSERQIKDKLSVIQVRTHTHTPNTSQRHLQCARSRQQDWLENIMKTEQLFFFCRLRQQCYKPRLNKPEDRFTRWSEKTWH